MKGDAKAIGEMKALHDAVFSEVNDRVCMPKGRQNGIASMSK
jgi:hypothetical protein